MNPPCLDRCKPCPSSQIDSEPKTFTRGLWPFFGCRSVTCAGEHKKRPKYPSRIFLAFVTVVARCSRSTQTGGASCSRCYCTYTMPGPNVKMSTVASPFDRLLPPPRLRYRPMQMPPSPLIGGKRRAAGAECILRCVIPPVRQQHWTDCTFQSPSGRHSPQASRRGFPRVDSRGTLERTKYPA